MINEIDITHYKSSGYTQPDPVHRPQHYMLLPNVEVRDVIEALVGKLPKHTPAMVASDYVQMMQYFMRFMEKNGLEDLQKGQWYLNKVMGALNNENQQAKR